MDAIIIGAGAAGLAAARELAQAGLSALVLEARDRIGGRCWSRQEPGLAVPIEYGAEFIHGRPASTLGLLRRCRIDAIERAGARWYVQLGALLPRDRDELFAQIRSAIDTAGAPRKDVSFADYLDRRLGKRLPADARTMAQRMVEGYDAADPCLASAQAIVAEWTADSPGHDRTFRPRGGYGAALAALAADLDGTGVRMRLQSIVRTVAWERGQVEVGGTFLGQPFRERAASAIVTLPLGVLQLPSTAPGAVRFRPALADKRMALARLASGAALKVILRFRSAFWETIEQGRYRDAGFFQAPDATFPTFWTALPERAPVLVAWTGGPRARRMSGADPAAIIRQALDSLRTLFGNGLDIEAELEAGHIHDWQSDPYACGAYSYAKVGGAGARTALAKTLHQTLYFAGEAADYEGETGTVAGALQSGVRAARELIAATAKARPRRPGRDE